jgi:hypothetical protein
MFLKRFLNNRSYIILEDKYSLLQKDYKILKQINRLLTEKNTKLELELKLKKIPVRYIIKRD